MTRALRPNLPAGETGANQERVAGVQQVALELRESRCESEACACAADGSSAIDCRVVRAACLLEILPGGPLGGSIGAAPTPLRRSSRCLGAGTSA